MAESEGFEPPLGCPKPDFESGAFDHSANSPRIGIIPVSFMRPQEVAAAQFAAHKNDTGAEAPVVRNSASGYFFGAAAFPLSGGVVAAGAAGGGNDCGGATALPFAFMSAK